MGPSVSKQFLWNYFEGKSTLAQKQMLLAWLEEAQHKELFFEVLHEWEKANPQIMLDMSSDWNELDQRLNGEQIREPYREEGDYQVSSLGANWYKLAAASVALLCLIGFWQRESLVNETYEAGYGETRSFLLRDGSRVTLNADSKLLYPRFGWLRKIREVSLSGEAEFSVIHTKDHRPFVVKTSDQN
jgi:transmembrane sensor